MPNDHRTATAEVPSDLEAWKAVFAAPADLTWDAAEIVTQYAAHLRKEDPALTEPEALARASKATFEIDYAWQQMLEKLQGMLTEISPSNRFHIEGRYMGWQKLDGSKTLAANDAQDFLQKLLPDTECIFSIRNTPAALFIRNSHHDAPTGEFYMVTGAAPE